MRLSLQTSRKAPTTGGVKGCLLFFYILMGILRGELQ